ncbi:MAG: RdgB/HAM1 family non-canonical purine NTP pyrophosphatase [Microbacteriaceae bacterium]
MTLEVVLATHNRHKVEEFRRILALAVPGVTVAGYDGPEPIEDGITFAENALIKARAAADHTGRVAMADDSGICVDVLGGAPGIFSARWAGTHGEDRANLRLLLDQLADIREPRRGAQFVCTIAVVVPASATRAAQERVVEGIWPGSIATEPRGENGFGYDPIFLPDGFEISAAELSATEKNTYSHRARAFTRLVPEFRGLIQ